MTSKNKDWLPNVGEECEYFWSTGEEWRLCECVAVYGHGVIVIDSDNACELVFSHEVRPIKSQSDIECEEDIDCIDRVIAEAIDYDQPMAKAIYDAGYRKQGEVVNMAHVISNRYESVKNNHNKEAYDDWIDKRFNITKKVGRS